jgi:hypothetical protein
MQAPCLWRRQRAADKQARTVLRPSLLQQHLLLAVSDHNNSHIEPQLSTHRGGGAAT